MILDGPGSRSRHWWPAVRSPSYRRPLRQSPRHGAAAMRIVTGRRWSLVRSWSMGGEPGRISRPATRRRHTSRVPVPAGWELSSASTSKTPASTGPMRRQAVLSLLGHSSRRIPRAARLRSRNARNTVTRAAARRLLTGSASRTRGPGDTLTWSASIALWCFRLRVRWRGLSVTRAVMSCGPRRSILGAGRVWRRPHR